MFEMNASIKVDGLQAFVPSSMKWSNTVVNYINTASVTIPSRCKQGNIIKPTQEVFVEGAKIELFAGYNDRLTARFTGFVTRIKTSTPLVLECEGYSYQLRQVVDFTESYKDATVKQILSDLIADTDIELSSHIPEITIPKVEFVHVSGFEVLDWLHEKCLLTVNFKNKEIYAGLSQVGDIDVAKIKLGWNTAKDKGLVTDADRELANVKITIQARKTDGTKTKSSSKGKKEKVLETVLQDSSAQKEIAEQKRKELTGKGYHGKVVAFLEPHINAGDILEITDDENNKRTGNYFCATVAGSYNKSGGRQTLEASYLV